MADQVGVRELRQNLSRYLERVKEGESLVVTERGREVARLVPSSGVVPPALERLLSRGASMPTGDLLAVDWSRPPRRRPARADSGTVLDEQRADRV